MSEYEQEILSDQTEKEVSETASVEDVVARLAEKREVSFDETVRSLEDDTTRYGFTTPIVPLISHCISEGVDITDFLPNTR